MGLHNLELRPGDCLVYRPRGWVGWAIATKTFHNVSHVEVALDPGKTALASRDGLGVNCYPHRWDDLGFIMRPPATFDLEDGLAYFRTVKGQKYDFWGLMAFFRFKSAANNGKQFCSEFATNFYRAGGVDVFHGERAEIVPPYYYAYLADGFMKVWDDGRG